MQYFRLLIISFGATVLLDACATAPDPATAYAEQPGPYAVKVVESVAVRDPVQERDVTLRVSYPDGEGPFPLIVYSHGAFCYPQLYAGVIDHWVSHGYVVVQPNHLDSPNLGKLNPAVIKILLTSRLRDMVFVLDEMDAIEAAVGGLAGKIDRERIAAGGHSFGGMIAQTMSGMMLKMPADESFADYSDSRFDVAVVMSGVGPNTMMDGTVMAEEGFAGLQKPLFASGGSLDTGNVGTGIEYPWEWRLAAYTYAPEGDKYWLALQNADHYMGGLICRENRGGSADPEGLAIVRAANTTFLNAYLKDDALALAFLQNADFGAMTDGRAELKLK
jgi:hypothetical protein